MLKPEAVSVAIWVACGVMVSKIKSKILKRFCCTLYNKPIYYNCAKNEKFLEIAKKKKKRFYLFKSQIFF